MDTLRYTWSIHIYENIILNIFQLQVYSWLSSEKRKAGKLLPHVIVIRIHSAKFRMNSGIHAESEKVRILRTNENLYIHYCCRIYVVVQYYNITLISYSCLSVHSVPRIQFFIYSREWHKYIRASNWSVVLISIRSYIRHAQPSEPPNYIFEDLKDKRVDISRDMECFKNECSIQFFILFIFFIRDPLTL